MQRLRLSRRGQFAAAAALAATAAVALLTSGASARPTAEPFKYGILTGINTFQNNIGVEMTAGAQAAAAAVNKQNGLGGRQVQVVPCSHQSQTAVAIQCARNFVEQNVDDVFQYGSFAPSAEPIVRAAGIPQITAATQNPQDFRAPTTFPVGGGTLECFGAATYYALEQPTIKTFAALGQVSAATSLNLAFQKTIVDRFGKGKKWLGTIFYPPTAATDILPYVQQLKDLKPDLIVSQSSQAAQAALMADLSQLGFAPKVMHVALIVGETDLAGYPDKGASMLIGMSFPPYSAAKQFPAVQAWLKDLKSAGLDGDPVNLKQESMHGWMNVWALKKLSQRIKGPVTKESMLAAVKNVTVKNPIDLFGLFPWTPGSKGPIAYPQDPGYPCWVAKGDSSGHLTLVSTKKYYTFKLAGLIK